MDALTIEDPKEKQLSKEFKEPLPVNNVKKTNVKLDKENKESKKVESWNQGLGLGQKKSELKSKKNRNWEEIMTSSNDEEK